jgi:hypothetical protein
MEIGAQGLGQHETPTNRVVDQTVEKLKGILNAKGVTLFALIDHSGEAEKIRFMPTRRKEEESDVPPLVSPNGDGRSRGRDKQLVPPPTSFLPEPFVLKLFSVADNFDPKGKAEKMRKCLY